MLSYTKRKFIYVYLCSLFSTNLSVAFYRVRQRVSHESFEKIKRSTREKEQFSASKWLSVIDEKLFSTKSKSLSSCGHYTYFANIVEVLCFWSNVELFSEMCCFVVCDVTAVNGSLQQFPVVKAWPCVEYSCTNCLKFSRSSHVDFGRNRWRLGWVKNTSNKQRKTTEKKYINSQLFRHHSVPTP